MEQMKTVSEVINSLREQGYTVDFNLEQTCIISSNKEHQLFHDDFIIDKVYRFEGMSDPADEATVYAISSKNNNVKGILVNGAGIYTDDVTDELLRTLGMKKQ